MRCGKVHAASVQQAGEPLRAVSSAMILSNWTRAKKPSFAYLQAAVNGGENNASTTVGTMPQPRGNEAAAYGLGAHVRKFRRHSSTLNAHALLVF